MSARLPAVLGVCAAVAALGCSGGTVKEDREKTLEALTTAVFLPSVDEFASSAAALTEALQGYCAAPTDAGLTGVRAEWRESHRSFRALAAFGFGPYEESRIGRDLDFWPVREADVERAVSASTVPIDATTFAALGASAKGLPALEYLVFGPRAGESSDPTRCAYALALAREIERRAEALALAWSPSSGDYAGELVRAGAMDSSIESTQTAIDLVLNGAVSALATLTDAQLGKPLGEKTGGALRPEECESRYAGDSVADYRAALGGVRRVWVGALEGDKGKGLTLLVRRSNTRFDDRVRASFDAAFRASAAMGATVTERPEAARAALAEARRLRQLVAVDAVQVMGGTLTFSDNDGD